MYFKPPEGNACQFYYRELVAQISYEKFFDFTTVRAIGWDFNPDSQPEFQIPTTVLIPACLPRSLAYATFILKNLSESPLIFSFSPPKFSRFVVKPEIGLLAEYVEFFTNRICKFILCWFF